MCYTCSVLCFKVKVGETRNNITLDEGIEVFFMMTFPSFQYAFTDFHVIPPNCFSFRMFLTFKFNYGHFLSIYMYTYRGEMDLCGQSISTDILNISFMYNSKSFLDVLQNSRNKLHFYVQLQCNTFYSSEIFYKRGFF